MGGSLGFFGPRLILPEGFAKSPGISLKTQNFGDPSNRRIRPLACDVKTRMGAWNLKINEVLNLSLVEIAEKAREIDGLKLRISNFRPEISLEMQSERLGKALRGVKTPYDLKTDIGHRLRANEALGLSLEELYGLASEVNARRPFLLRNLGLTKEYESGGKTWEVLLRPDRRKLESFGINLGKISNRKEQERAIAEMNKKLGSGIDFLDQEAAKLISRRFTKNLPIWFYTQKSRMVRDDIIELPLAHSQFVGLVIRKPKSARKAA